MPPGMAGRQTAPKSFVEAKTFYPTMEEFSDFMGYITKLEDEHKANEAGFCKIVPPKEWVPRKSGYNLEDMNFTIQGPIKQKFQNIGDPGCFQTKGIIQPKMNVLDYHKLATSARYRTPANSGHDDLEKKYWKSLSYNSPIYGCDVANCITDEDVEVWNIAKLDSILKVVAEDMDTVIQGVNSPYLYFGMWKATFSWHVEDMDLYAINMVHYGEPKTWYCVPPKYGHLLEKACHKLFPNVASFCSNFMRHKTCLLNPTILDRFGVPYQKMVQREREIIVVFPYAYHSGFNHGFNIAESTNFATERWIEFGKRQRPCDCDRARVKFSMDPFILKFHGEKELERWKSGIDIAPHPFDPPEVAKEILRRAQNPEDYVREMAEKNRKQEEKRLRKLEMQNKLRMERQAAAKAAAQASSATVPTDNVQVFHWKENVNVVIEVQMNENQQPVKIVKGREILEKHQVPFNDQDLAKLIEEGTLISNKVKADPSSKKRKASNDGVENSSEEMKTVTDKKAVALYKHVAKEDVHMTIDPQTMEITSGRPSKALVEFLQEAGPANLKDLIASNIFIKVCDCILEVKRVIPVNKKQQVLPPPAKKSRKSESSSPFVAEPEPIIRNMEVYMFKESKALYSLSQNKRFVGRVNKAPFGNREPPELIEEGLLVKVGTRVGKPKMNYGIFKIPIHENQMEIASMGNATVFSFIHASDLCEWLETSDEDNFVSQGSFNMTSPLTLLEELLTCHPCKNHPEQQEADCTSCQNIKNLLLSNFDPEATCLYKANVKTLTIRCHKTERTYVVKERKLSPSIFYPPTQESVEVPTMAQMPSTNEVDRSQTDEDDYFDDGDDDEELYTSDESSESNDESSDDPDYGGSGNIREWKSASRQKLKMKKMKRSLREKREERRQKRMANGDTANGRRKAIDEAPQLTALTKSLLDGSIQPDEEITIDSLVERFKADKNHLVMVLRIFRGFDIVTKIENSVYKWKGKDDEKIKDVLATILQTEKGDDMNDATWNVCCDILKALLTSRKNLRVFLPIIAETCEAGKPKHLIRVAAVIEGMDLADKLSDGLGGLVYKGPDVYTPWLRSLFEKHQSEHNLKEISINLTKEDVKEEHRYPIEPPTFPKTLYSSNAGAPRPIPEHLKNDPDILRSVANWSKFCQCGSTKTLEKEVIISREGHRKHSRKTAHIGGKRKKRCFKCDGCKAKSCGSCNFCLNPALKKPCMHRSCHFPVPPNCPCFD